MDIYLNTVQFELTRRCNDNCIHCCRGEAQELELSPEVIDAFFENNNIVSLGRFLLSGGEPTLGAAAFEYLVDKIIEKKIHVRNFSFSINGKNYDERFNASLKKFGEYILSLKDKKYKIPGTFWISNNQFHTAPPKEIVDKYSKFPFFVPYRKERQMHLKVEDILPVGRALDNNLSPHSLDVEQIWGMGIKYQTLNHNDRECLYLPYLYISSNGNIQNDYGSMYSFDLMDNYTFGNVLYEKIEEIVLNEEKNKYTNIEKETSMVK